MLRSIIIIFMSTTLLIACHQQDDQLAPGYIEGRYTYLAAPSTGILQSIIINRGEYAQLGSPLAELEPEPEKAELEQAMADDKAANDALNTVLAKEKYAELTYQRYQSLVAKKVLQEANLDEARANYLALQSQASEARSRKNATAAAIHKVNWYMQKKVLTAPVTGLVFDTYYRVGELVEAGHPILSVLAPEDVKVIFYVPEKYLSRLKLKQKVTVYLDGRKPLAANITYIAPTAEFTPPVIYDNKTNEKLIFRIEAGFSDTAANRMHPGQPVSVAYQS